MKPKPLESLKNLTVPVVVDIISNLYLIFYNYETKKKEINYIESSKKEIADLKYENRKLRTQLINLNKKIRNYQDQQNNQIKNYQQQHQQKSQLRTKNSKEVVHMYNKYKKTSSDKSTVKNKKQTSNKIYQKFSKNIRLVSDSRISILDNNKLKVTKLLTFFSIIAQLYKAKEITK